MLPVQLATLDRLSVLQFTDGDDAPILILLLAAVGVAAVYGGWQRYEAKRLIEDTPTESVRSMAAGRTELSGRARAVDEPFEQPFGGGEAVVATYEIEEYESSGKHSSWNTKESGTLAAPFLLEDETGEAVVDPTAELELKVSDRYESQVTVGRTEEEPASIRHFLRTHSKMNVPDAGLSGVLFGEKRRYTQRVITPGETVYVLGGASPRPGIEVETDQDLVIGPEDASGSLIVSDMNEDRLASNYGRGAVLVIALGVLALAGAFYLLLSTLGIS